MLGDRKEKYHLTICVQGQRNLIQPQFIWEQLLFIMLRLFDKAKFNEMEGECHWKQTWEELCQKQGENISVESKREAKYWVFLHLQA